MKIIKSLEDSSLLADGISETVKNVIKQPRSAFLGMLLQNLSSLVLGKILSKKVIRAEKGAKETRIISISIDHINQNSSSPPSVKQYQDYY